MGVTRHVVEDCFLSSYSFILVARILHTGFPTDGFSCKCRLQRGLLLSQVNISPSRPLVQVAPHWNLGAIIDSRKPTFNVLNLLSRPAWEYQRIFESVWYYLKGSEINTCRKQKTLLCLCCHCCCYCCCWIKLDEPSTHSWQDGVC